MHIGINGFFGTFETTGSGQYLRGLVPALKRVAPDLTITVFVPWYLAERNLWDSPWRIVPLDTPFDRLQPQLAKVWFEQISFPRACQKHEVDVAHVPYFASPRWPRLPTVVTVHDLIPLILPAYRGSMLVRGYTRLVAQAAKRAHIVLTDSQSSAHDIHRFLNIPAERLRVIPLAVDRIFRPLSREACVPVLHRLHLPDRYLLYLGGFDRRKNVHTILQAYARVWSHISEIPLVIAGRLPQKDSYLIPDPRATASRLGLERRVHFTGWIAEEDKPALYNGAVAFLFPSSYEGFGLPVLEALSCGTPAVVGSGTSLVEVGGPGVLRVPPGQVQPLAEAMEKMVNDPDLRRQLSEQGLEHAHRFSWERTARETLDAYREAIARAH